MTLILGLEAQNKQEYEARQCIRETKVFNQRKTCIKGPRRECFGDKYTCQCGSEQSLWFNTGRQTDRPRLKAALGTHGMLQSSPAARAATLQESSVFCFLVEPENLQTLSLPHFLLLGCNHCARHRKT